MGNLNVEIVGSGPPVLVLHGWGHNLLVQKPLGELLANDFQVHLIDLPGFGQSPAPDTDWGTKDYADRIISYMDEAGLKQVALIGHSFGGRISIRLAATVPDRIGQVVLMCSHGLQRERTAKEKLRISTLGYLRSAVKLIDKLLPLNLYRGWYSTKFGSADYKAAGKLQGTLVKTVIEDQTENAKKIKAPTLLLWGAEDTETPPELGKRFSELITDSEYIELPGKGHEPFAGAGAHLCATYIKKFLSSSNSRVKEAGR